MIRIIKDISNKPSSLSSPACLSSLNSVIQGNTSEIKSDYYRGIELITSDGSRSRQVVEALKTLYHNKCAYCETFEFDPEIEHYRPKKRVIRVKPSHPGYYWLCYEWTNLLPTCHACNELIRGKGNQFPIIDENSRQRKPPILADGRLDENSIKANTSPLIDERPYLLHPEIDEPKHFFKFKENGRIEGIDDEGRGKETIKICNLNRGNLKVARQTIIDDYYQIINDALYRFYNLLKTDKKIAQTQLRTDLKLIFQRLETQQNSNYQYSLFSWYIFENFEDIVIPLFSNLEHKNVISNAFSLYRTGNFN